MHIRTAENKLPLLRRSQGSEGVGAGVERKRLLYTVFRDTPSPTPQLEADGLTTAAETRRLFKDHR